jgi:hypothetical protein
MILSFLGGMVDGIKKKKESTHYRGHIDYFTNIHRKD